MSDADRTRLLFGPYRSPRCSVAGKLYCEMRCRRATVTNIADTPIPWPWCGRGPILCGALVRAVQRESATAICHWWGVTAQTVTKWRKILGVEWQTPGTVDLYRRWFDIKVDEEVRQRRLASTQDPERNAKISAAKLGKPRPPHVHEALRRANLGRRLSRKTRKKLSEAQKCHHRLRPHPQAWTPEEDALLGTATDRGVAAKIGRRMKAVHKRRVKLGIPALRKRS